MEKLPHRYEVRIEADADAPLHTATSEGATLSVAPPAAFGGEPGGWSPEHLLVNAVVSCFVLTFRAMAPLHSLEWGSLECAVTGDVDKVDGVLRFTGFAVKAVLSVPPGTGAAKARRVLEKAKAQCLVTNSLSAAVSLDAEVRETS